MAAAQRRDVSGTGQLAAFVTPDLHARQHEDLKEHTAKERTGTKSPKRNREGPCTLHIDGAGAGCTEYSGNDGFPQYNDVPEDQCNGGTGHSVSDLL
ncbi:hypothetical protein ABBQ32_001617 [Trebouxia sp. C0010 RCD-2024]